MNILENAKIGEHYRTRGGRIATLYAILTGCERYQYRFYVCSKALTYDEVLERVFSSSAIKPVVTTHNDGLWCELIECEDDIISKI